MGVHLFSDQNTFSFRDRYLNYGQTAKLNQNKRGHHVYPVQTHDFQACIKSICATRQDAWVDQIYGRIEAVNDLHAADTIYHQTCNVNFRISKLFADVLLIFGTLLCHTNLQIKIEFGFDLFIFHQVIALVLSWLTNIPFYHKYMK